MLFAEPHEAREAPAGVASRHLAQQPVFVSFVVWGLLRFSVLINIGILAAFGKDNAHLKGIPFRDFFN